MVMAGLVLRAFSPRVDNRLQAYSRSHHPEESKTGLHTAQLWSPDNAAVPRTGGIIVLLGSRFGGRLTTEAAFRAPLWEWVLLPPFRSFAQGQSLDFSWLESCHWVPCCWLAEMCPSDLNPADQGFSVYHARDRDRRC